eukprot:TRINITY_DN45615_c0_g1_i1.p1 TRINITY_DN45615_c0_g1~~TRINITY_DN45615_c0_g1_i1.p1  ORF type:complete len:272 (+),score=23.66 TRINITY_DN45615_c0_g1_i1:102-917(+)
METANVPSSTCGRSSNRQYADTNPLYQPISGYSQEAAAQLGPHRSQAVSGGVRELARLRNMTPIADATVQQWVSTASTTTETSTRSFSMRFPTLTDSRSAFQGGTHVTDVDDVLDQVLSETLALEIVPDDDFDDEVPQRLSTDYMMQLREQEPDDSAVPDMTPGSTVTEIADAATLWNLPIEATEPHVDAPVQGRALAAAAVNALRSRPIRLPSSTRREANEAAGVASQRPADEPLQIRLPEMAMPTSMRPRRARPPSSQSTHANVEAVVP